MSGNDRTVRLKARTTPMTVNLKCRNRRALMHGTSGGNEVKKSIKY